jgi:5-carboxymethyl-2-hydroxymuconate isomerase
MPHLVILYTPNLERETDMSALCRALADTMLGVKDELGQQVFPTGGVRVLAYPAAHSAIADGRNDYAFAYFHLRMGRGRSELVKKQAGEALSATVGKHFASLLKQRYVGLTLQIDEGQEVFDSKQSSIHPLFSKAP